MTSEQRYEGKGELTQNLEQSAQNALKSPHPADDRPIKSSPTFITVNESVWNGLNDLLDKVDGFLQVGNASAKIEVINNLTQHWLITAPNDLPNNREARHQLEIALQLTTFLSEVEAALANVDYFLYTQAVYPTQVSTPPIPSTISPTNGQPSTQLSTEAIVESYQARLLDLVDAYMEWTNPILAITELLESWLTMPPKDLANDHYKRQLGSVMRLVDFMTELRDAHEAWVRYTNLLSNGKEVQHD